MHETITEVTMMKLRMSCLPDKAGRLRSCSSVSSEPCKPAAGAGLGLVRLTAVGRVTWLFFRASQALFLLFCCASHFQALCRDTAAALPSDQAMTTASPLPGERPSRCLRLPNPLLPSLLSSRMPRAPSFHVGAQRSALSSGSGGNAIAEPSGWSGSSASRIFHHASPRLFAKAIQQSFVFSNDSPEAMKETGPMPFSL